MRPFANRAEAIKQNRMQLGEYTCFGSPCEIFAALPHEDLHKYLHKKIKYKFPNDVEHISSIVAIGYDCSGGCWPVAILENGEKHCLGAQGYEYIKILNSDFRRPA